MTSFWSGTVADFLRREPGSIIGTLAEAQIRHFRLNEAQQVRAWERTITMLRAAFVKLPQAISWTILLEYPMLRLGRRPDVILLTGHAVLVLEIKAGAQDHTSADRRQVEDYAIDLHDFHAGCREHPIIPILVAEHASIMPAAAPLILGHGVTPPIDANSAQLADVLAELDRQTAMVAAPLDAWAWCEAPYAPVPTIIDAACLLYAKHGVAEIRSARSDASNLSATTAAILAAIAAARDARARLILFVTGIPGAGKTLCGLNAIFGIEQDIKGTYLTGNPTLVHVLREALARDAIAYGTRGGDARRKMAGVIQELPKFRDHYVASPTHAPAERIIVVDEAQRCWSAAYAVQKTRDKAHPLTTSEPAHLLEAMARHDGFCAVVCLVGSGQEIHAGEGGLAEWGNALRDASDAGIAWRVCAPPALLTATDRRQQLGPLPELTTDASLHLTVPIRQIRERAAAAWVDAVLLGKIDDARTIAAAAGGVPFHLTRNAETMRTWLRTAARGLRRAGLLASAAGARLRAEGLGAELPHMDAAAVAHWFLDRFPEDVRASDALEVVATEFSCQGLELDYVGLCWDADMIPEEGHYGWKVRKFRGTKWQAVRAAEEVANQINTYRVLLTRARYDTVIFVPNGSTADPTRSPDVYNAIASFLRACGASDLSAVAPSDATSCPGDKHPGPYGSVVDPSPSDLQFQLHVCGED